MSERVVQPRSDRPGRDTEDVSNLGEIESLVEVENDDNAVVDAQPAEGSLNLVAIRKLTGTVDRGWLYIQHANTGQKRAVSARLVVAGAHQQSLEPRLKSGVVTQRRKVAPSPPERGLDSVLGPIVVLQDAPGDGEHAVDR